MLPLKRLLKSGAYGKEVGVLRGHVGPVLAARFNGDGNYCLSCGKDRTLRLWNPHRGIHIKTYKSHGREVRDVHVTSMSKSSEVGHLKDEFNRLGVDSDGTKDEKFKSELVLCQFHPACAEVHNLRSYLLRVIGGRERFLSKVDQLGSLEVEIEKLEGKYDYLQSNADLFCQQLNQRISCFEVEMREKKRQLTWCPGPYQKKSSDKLDVATTEEQILSNPGTWYGMMSFDRPCRILRW